jgi:hypothetical protein
MFLLEIFYHFAGETKFQDEFLKKFSRTFYTRKDKSSQVMDNNYTSSIPTKFWPFDRTFYGQKDESSLILDNKYTSSIPTKAQKLFQPYKVLPNT